MPSKLQVDESFAFLFMCIEASGCKIDFRLVGDATNLQPAAARMRYTRLKKAVEDGVFAGAILSQPPPLSSKLAAMAQGSNRSTKGGRPTKRLRASGGEQEDSKGDDEFGAQQNNAVRHSIADLARAGDRRRADGEPDEDASEGLSLPDTSRTGQDEVKQEEGEEMEDDEEDDDSDYTPTVPVQSRSKKNRSRSAVSHQHSFHGANSDVQILAGRPLLMSSDQGNQSLPPRKFVAHDAANESNRVATAEGRRLPAQSNYYYPSYSRQPASSNPQAGHASNLGAYGPSWPHDSVMRHGHYRPLARGSGDARWYYSPLPTAYHHLQENAEYNPAAYTGIRNINSVFSNFETSGRRFANSPIPIPKSTTGRAPTTYTSSDPNVDPRLQYSSDPPAVDSLTSYTIPASMQASSSITHFCDIDTEPGSRLGLSQIIDSGVPATSSEAPKSALDGDQPIAATFNPDHASEASTEPRNGREGSVTANANQGEQRSGEDSTAGDA